MRRFLFISIFSLLKNYQAVKIIRMKNALFSVEYHYDSQNVLSFHNIRFLYHFCAIKAI